MVLKIAVPFVTVLSVTVLFLPVSHAHTCIKTYIYVLIPVYIHDTKMDKVIILSKKYRWTYIKQMETFLSHKNRKTKEKLTAATQC